MIVNAHRHLTVGAVVLAAALLLGFACASSALAAAPWWRLTSGSRPTYLPPEGEGQIIVTAANLGDAAVNGETTPVTVVDDLPEGLRAVSVEAVAGSQIGSPQNRGPVSCALASTSEVSCTFAGTLPSYDSIEVKIGVQVESGASSAEANRASVFGGEAQSASIVRPIVVSGEETPFGVEDYDLSPEEEGGSTATQAGSHPFQLTGTVTLNQTAANGSGSHYFATPAALPKDVQSSLPPGLIGNPTPFPRCTLTEFLTEIEGDRANECPSQSAVGVAIVTFTQVGGGGEGTSTVTVPIFNLEPKVSEPARFGFVVEGLFPVTLDTFVRTGGDYGITVGSSNITETAELISNTLVFWGVPGDSSHDNSRGSQCINQARGEHVEHPCVNLDELKPPPLLSLPTSCTGPLQTSLEVDSWQEPANKLLVAGGPMPALDGCNRLSFAPSVKVTPDGTAGSTPTGLNVDVHVPQDSVLAGKGLAESNVKDISVTLPEGVALNPAGADGLQACSEGQIGFTGVQPSGTDLFTPGLPELFCPDASKVGTVKIKTPLLPNVLEGAVYLASQDQNPFGSLVAMYVVAQDPVSGTLVKLPGEVSLSATGQITGTFKNNPQLPFEDAELHFFGGERAPLATPAHCGTYTTHATFTPWSGNESASSTSDFQVTTGPNGAPCPGPTLPFAPTLTAGTTSIQAGGFSPFTMTMSREDGNQNLQAISLRMPPGLSGLLTGVKLCGEAQANAGTCGPDSQIGETIVSVGLGGSPYSVTGGKVFITEGYEGAPYGLSIVNPAKAGPFDLGQVVVRAKIEVNPITAALTITSDSSGPYAIPHILDGIPLQIKHVNVTINRPGFTFNPTNCNPMSITGALSSTEGASAAVSVPLQVTNCAVLGFKPGFTVSTAGKTSRANGASLHVKLTYPKAAFGSQANIAKVKVDLPKQLPSRLTTLQKACPSATFNANPASCSPQSRIGEAKATTPLLPVPLSGPAYFVSYGGAKFPELVIVLSGYGTTVDLHAETFISKAGITSSTFRTVPDVPVGTFELTLPQGKFSALAANGNLCKETLKMPTDFTAQNGAVIKQSTPIGVTGCPKSKHVKKGKKSTAHRGGKRK